MQQLNPKDGGDGIKRPPVALLHAESHRRDAWRFESLRIRSSGRGRRASMRSFLERGMKARPGIAVDIYAALKRQQALHDLRLTARDLVRRARFFSHKKPAEAGSCASTLTTNPG